MNAADHMRPRVTPRSSKCRGALNFLSGIALLIALGFGEAQDEDLAEDLARLSSCGYEVVNWGSRVPNLDVRKTAAGPPEATSMRDSPRDPSGNIERGCFGSGLGAAARMGGSGSVIGGRGGIPVGPRDEALSRRFFVTVCCTDRDH